MPHVPSVANVELAPDWVCELLSPSTERVDREIKLPIHLREQVRHLWLIDPVEQRLSAYAHDGRGWESLAVHRGPARVRIAPFDAIELDLAELWSD